jgi:DNA mismatch endonuclease, patch repair protein
VTDSLTPEKRSWNMSRIRSRDTKPEKIVRSLLHRMGYRFRLGTRIQLPAPEPGARALNIRPDVVLPKHRTVIFVHGCFWHRHPGCRLTTTPGTRVEFWQKKFTENIARDQRNETALRTAGWNVVVVWECELAELDALLQRLHDAIRRVTRYTPPENPERLIAAERPEV